MILNVNNDNVNDNENEDYIEQVEMTQNLTQIRIDNPFNVNDFEEYKIQMETRFNELLSRVNNITVPEKLFVSIILRNYYILIRLTLKIFHL